MPIYKQNANRTLSNLKSPTAVNIDMEFATGADLEIGDNRYAFKAKADNDAGVKFNSTDASVDFMSTTATEQGKCFIETGIFRKGGVRVSTQFDKTNTTLAAVTGLSRALLAGRSYHFLATLFINADVTGGSKYTMGGTGGLTATNIIYNINLLDNATKAYTITSRQTALGGNAGQAGTTAGLCSIEGLITVNAAGTLSVAFAQNAVSGTSSVLVGSSLIIEEIS